MSRVLDKALSDLFVCRTVVLGAGVVEKFCSEIMLNFSLKKSEISKTFTGRVVAEVVVVVVLGVLVVVVVVVVVVIVGVVVVVVVAVGLVVVVVVVVVVAVVVVLLVVVIAVVTVIVVVVVVLVIVVLGLDVTSHLRIGNVTIGIVMIGSVGLSLFVAVVAVKRLVSVGAISEVEGLVLSA